MATAIWQPSPIPSAKCSATTIKVAMATGLRSSLVLFRDLHLLGTQTLAQGVLQQSPVLPSSPSSIHYRPTDLEANNSEMGNLFSKEKRRSKHGRRGYSPIEDNGRYPQESLSGRSKIDPRDAFPQKDWYQGQIQQQRQLEQYKQRPRQGDQSRRQQHQPQPRPPQHAPYQPQRQQNLKHQELQQQQQQQQQAQKRRQQQPQDILPEYELVQVSCLYHKDDPMSCPFVPDLNSNMANRFAYRDPANDGRQCRKWKLAVDFCSLAALRSGKQAADLLTATMGDRTYGDPYSEGNDMARRGKKKFGGRFASSQEQRAPFSIEELLNELERLGARYEEKSF
ncbi:hypothetical protein C7999DRAFT_16902 [Corynascus novoguineensis]|uniref:Uncharacterized protein n=1 Tax=Corynascus novoguineensis TaxID=1126955 RepID=A0AAN7CPF2_9PEZI|nr:hypothetical protein C7999DRAFT_16902 [Corynascus novoguineensis]